MVTLTFPDGARREFPSGTTGLDIAKGISPSLAKRTVAMALDGAVADLSDPIKGDAKIEFLNREDPRALELIRHDAAHVLAETHAAAAQRLDDGLDADRVAQVQRHAEVDLGARDHDPLLAVGEAVVAEAERLQVLEPRLLEPAQVHAVVQVAVAVHLVRARREAGRVPVDHAGDSHIVRM